MIVAGPTHSSPLFLNKTLEMGPIDLHATQFKVLDIDGDGEKDLVALEGASLPVIYSYHSLTKKYKANNRMNLSHPCTTISFADFDRDGISDVVCLLLKTGSWNNSAIDVYLPAKNFKTVAGINLTDEEKKALSHYAVADFDNDGYLDLILLFHSKKISPIFMFGGKEGFFRSSLITPLAADLYTHAEACDINQDGKMDIIATTSSGRANYLFLNQSHKKEIIFLNYAEESGLSHDHLGTSEAGEGGIGLTSSSIDYNNDKIMDVAIGNEWAPHFLATADRSAILTGSAYKFPFKFVRTEFENDLEPFASFFQEFHWADLNGDGLWDLLIEDSGRPPHSRFRIMIQNVDHSFSDQAPLLGLDILNPSGAFVFDANHDGKLDIIVGQNSTRTNISPSSYLFIQNDNKNQSNLIELKLGGQKSNLQGIGARIIFSTNLRERRMMMNYPFVYLTLSSKEILKSVEVSWPSDIEREKIVKYTLNLRRSGNLLLSENGKWSFLDWKNKK